MSSRAFARDLVNHYDKVLNNSKIPAKAYDDRMVKKKLKTGKPMQFGLGFPVLIYQSCHFYFHSCLSQIKTATNNNLPRIKVIIPWHF